jgi:hypothetical protein
MNNVGFHTVFDASTTGWRYWWFPAIGLIFVMIGVAMPLMIRTGAFRSKPLFIKRWLPRLFLGFAIVWTTATFFVTFFDYRSSVSALKENRAEMIEGPVTDFHPMPYSGHVDESFVVNGVKFEYSDYGVTAGFNNTTSHGGPIREGLMVRIWHHRGRILRLDIKEDANKPHALDAGLRLCFIRASSARASDAHR